VPRVALLVVDYDAPNRVELPVLRQKVVSTQPVDRDVPDTHDESPTARDGLLESPTRAPLSGTAYRSLENLSSRPHISFDTSGG